MVYTNFTSRKLKQLFELQFEATQLFDNKVLRKIEPSAWLLESIKRARRLGFGGEKSRSERLVSPILTELSILNDDIFTIYSGMLLNVEESKGLNGECDFILSFSKIQDFLVSPVFFITQAKKQDIEAGTVQCVAQLFAAHLFNEQEQNPIKTLYGCSTTGVEWRFLKFENQTITLDTNRYLLTELEQLLGVLQHIVELTKVPVLSANSSLKF